ncbi:hypothetical protein I6A60_38170 [Frankia sp. AgB1.9]|uniref:hypothetical protein n=1 Tax=unclassified Frankia TaxID=2632575 RepID=UPI00193191A5|nr:MULTISPECIES: hypothetical protein [unclassified Frankia]MBL7494043.1 hypothetical protein [Frankia sp. AgW1.1]MBL7553619.1 hypothetical protein [Frankia sp. AgB1.9]MBL7624787.1 hypothetical protein [Frankia sp. AgB1.8]
MTLALKLLLAPLLVVASSLAGRRWGPALAGTLVALPVVAGPILLITDLQHGRQFAAQAANAALLGLVTLALFAVVFAYESRTLGWKSSLALGWCASLTADLALSSLVVPPPIGLLLALLATGTAVAVMPAAHPVNGGPTLPAPPRWDLPGRALATAFLVLSLTGAAATLGPRLTGVLAPFPIATSVVAAFTLAQAGHPPTATLLRGVLRGLTGFATFCFLVAELVGPAGTFLAFSAALVAAVLVQLVVTQAAARVGRRVDRYRG